MKIIGGTGHRPNKIGGYNLPNPIYNYVCKEIERILLEEKPDKVISGMALGYDMWLANIAIKLNIPLISAIPFLGQEKAWPEKSQRVYHALLNKAQEKIIVCPGDYAPQKMQIRNEYIVNNSTIILGCWNGTAGGTANCINYAKSQNKKFIFINPSLVNGA